MDFKLMIVSGSFGLYGFLGIWSGYRIDSENSHDQKQVTRKPTVIEKFNNEIDLKTKCSKLVDIFPNSPLDMVYLIS